MAHRRLWSTLTALLAVLVGLCLAAASAAACTKTWTGLGGDDKASDANNWSVCPNSPPSVPTAADDVSLETSGTTIDLDLGLTVHSWTMGTSGTVTIMARASANNTGITAAGGFTNGPQGTITLDGGNGTVTVAAASGAGSGTLVNQGTITLESTSPTSFAAPPVLVGNLVNTGRLNVETASQYQGGYTFDNKGRVSIAKDQAFTTTGAGPTNFVNDAGGSIAAAGGGNLAFGQGTFTQGAGTTTGAQPVILTGLDTLRFTGSGASHFETIGGTSLAGNLSPRQAIHIVSRQPNAGVSALRNIINRGVITVDSSSGTANLDMRSYALTNQGTLVLRGAGSAGTPTVSGVLVNAGLIQVASNAVIGPGVGRTSLIQRAGNTRLAPGATLDFSHTGNSGFRLLGGALSGTGTLLGTRVTNSGATIGPGRPGALTIQGSYAQTQKARLLIPLQGSSARKRGQLVVTGNVALGGSLLLALTKVFSDSVKQGTALGVLHFGGVRTGKFKQVAAEASCRAWTARYTHGTRDVLAVAGPKC